MDRVTTAIVASTALFTFVSGKDASTQTTERPTMLEELKNLEVIDYIRTAAVAIGLIAPLLHGRRTWLMAIVVGGVLGSLGDFFFPQQILSHVTKTEVDVVHQYLLQVVAITFVGRIATIYKTWESRDPGVSTSILVAGAVTGLMFSVSAMFDYNKWQNRFAPQYLTLAALPWTLMALGCIVYVFRGSSFGKGNLDFRGRLSRHILIDVMFLFVAAFVYFGYPDMPLANVTLKGFKADGVHYHLIRVLGVSCFGSAIYEFMSLGYQNESDQKDILFGRVVMYAATFPVFGLYQWKYHFFEFGNNIGLIVLTFCIMGNVLCGYFDLQWPKAKRH